ncbi:type I-E CRISPR-associated protein Cse2/CasB [Streptomyces sp. I05A-00742]|uniref:type I-E CRISPR-associated protein Cse2/CasB n=1 Tax=Streptomyces sp. I05A-00742 TaxID=2732853 RepID=UPI0014898C00|nr:type I-E CRISPR-associated protein Cse2/CasB [Streptomyces sp. I05A-00742]
MSSATEPGAVATGNDQTGDDQTGSARLAAWLTSLVRNRDYGQLAQLRRTGGQTNAHIIAGWYVPESARETGGREVYEQVAFLFAVYHRGVSRPVSGHGSLGTAARRIGSPMGRGPQDPGASRLLDRVVTSRRVPWRHLQHAITRLRACEQVPPSWTQLVDDLMLWHDRKARIAYQWAVDFHAPYDTGRKTTQKGSSS